MTEQVIRSVRGESVLSLLSPAAMVRGLWRHRGLVWQIARRDILLRYRSSWLGMAWSVLTPLALLAIYTFVFAVVFKARWGDDPNESRGVFALTMFCGMLVFNVFSEVAGRSSTLITDNANYVTKVVFPLEVFVASALLTALFNALIGFGVWLVGWGLIMQTIPPATVLLLPVVLLPIVLVSLGTGWVLASLGTFVRDVGPAVALLTQVLFFATPVFYRIDRVPESFQWVMRLNPLTHAVEDARRVMLGGVYLEWLKSPAGTGLPDWSAWSLSLAGALVSAVLGYAFFMKSKRAFADVL